MVTIKDLSKMAKVSPTTVSNVLHGRTNKVSPDTLSTVKKVIAEMHYVPNMGGRLLAQHGSRIIGVIMTYARRTDSLATSNPFYSEIIGSFETGIRSYRYFMMLYTSGDVTESLALAQSWDVEGLIILGSTPTDAKDFFNKVKVPVVFIDTYGDGIPNIGINDRESMKGLVEHLIMLGHRRIAFLTDSTVLVGVDKERYQGYQDALQQNRIDVCVRNLIHISYHDSLRRQELRSLRDKNFNGCTALCYTSDLYAVDAISCLSEDGMKIPNDISITGFDGNVLARLATPQLMTVAQDIQSKGRVAVDTLMEQIKVGQKSSVNIQLETHLVNGKSVRQLV